jgi:osmotically-inducible protein OsmY
MITRLRIICISFLFLQSCMNAAVTGAQAAYNNHNLQDTFTDHHVALRSSQAIYLHSDRYKDTNVSVTSFNQVVVLTGQVSDLKQKEEIGEIVKNTSKAEEVYNLINIGPPPSILTQISDAWITTKIKTKMVATREIDPNKVKVITENGTVYLIGIIPHQQADISIDIAKNTDGVQNVVKVFSYLTISKV